MKKIRRTSRLVGKGLAILFLALGGGALVSSSAFAALATVATASNSVEAGTLLLTQVQATDGDNTSGGIDTDVALAPGDIVHRFIDLERDGTLDGQLPKLSLSSDESPLTNQQNKGLYIQIEQCTVAYDLNDGTCSGTTSTVLANASVYSMLSDDVALSLDSTSAGVTSHLKVTFQILQSGENGPEEYEETTVNGLVYDAQSDAEKAAYNASWNGGLSVLGKSATLNWVFSEELRTNTTTNE